MPKSSVFKDTSEVLSAAFPFLLKGLKEISDAIPMPVGSIIKGVVQATIFLMETAEKYKTSKDDIYLLSARSAQIVMVIVNESQGQRRLDSCHYDDSNLEGIKSVIEEISSWISRVAAPKRRERCLGFLKSDDIIREVRCLNEKLDNAISRYGLQRQIAGHKNLSAILKSLDRTKELITDLAVTIKSDLERMEIRQLLEKNRVETLLSTDSRCLLGTRSDILRELEAWLDASQSTASSSSPSIYWFTGVAGCGKSTISRSVRDLATARNLPCSYFSFSRDFDDRRRSDKLMTTVAIDLIYSGDTTLVHNIYLAIKQDRISGLSPFPQQVHGFLKTPLHAANRPVVLIWDALDECTEPNSRRMLLELLGTLPELPSTTRIILTGRREDDLECACRNMGTKVRQHDLTFDPDNKDDFTTHDITTYFLHHSDQMRRMGKFWLDDAVVPKLVSLSDGLFTAAHFICRFVDHPDGQDRLLSLLNQPAYYDKGGSITDNLYRWYCTGLEHIFDEDGPHAVQHAQRIMAVILVAQYPLPGTALATLLDLDEGDVSRTLGRLSPFLVLAQRKTGVRLVHKSMSDFLVSKKAGRFYTQRVLASAHLGASCLQILHDQISATFTQSTHKFKVSVALEYACRFWGYHLNDVRRWEDVGELLHDLFYSHLLEWMHIMGCLDALDSALSCLKSIGTWKLASEHTDLLELARDCFCFLQEFHYPLRTYSTMNYPSLYLTPTKTKLYQVYSTRAMAQSSIIKGISHEWLPLQRTISEHKGRVTSVAFSPDGKYIISGSGDKTLCIWNVLTGQPLGSPLEGHTSGVTSAAFSPDGKYAASGSYDNTVCIWNALTGQCLRVLRGHRGWVSSVAFSPDGTKIVSGSGDMTVCIWDVVAGWPLRSLEGHTDWVSSVAFSPDGRQIVSGSGDKIVIIWDAITGWTFRSLKGHTDWVSSVAVSPDGRYIVSGSGDKTVCIWNTFTGQLLGDPLEGHKGWVRTVAFSPDGKHIVSGSGDKTICIWNAFTGQPLRSLEGHMGWVTSVAFSPDGNHYVSGSSDKTVRLWNALASQHLGLPLEGHRCKVSCVAFSPDGKHIVSGSYDNLVCIWDALTGQLLGSPLERHTSWVSTVIFSPDGKYFVSGSSDMTLCMWDVVTGQLLRLLEGHSDWVSSVAISPDGKYIVSGSGDKTLQVWNALTGQSFGAPLEGHSSWIGSVAFSPDGKHIVSGSGDKTICIWNAITGKLVRSPLEGHRGWVLSVAFSPDGRYIVSGSGDNTVCIWDVLTGKSSGLPLEGHINWVRSVSFSPDGKHIISQSSDNYVCVWDVLTRELLKSSKPGDNTDILSSGIQAFTLFSDGWLTSIDQKQICWLPNHGDVTITAWSEFSKSIFVGYESGQIIIIRFN